MASPIPKKQKDVRSHVLNMAGQFGPTMLLSLSTRLPFTIHERLIIRNTNWNQWDLLSGFQCGAIWHYTSICNSTSFTGGNCNLSPDFVFGILVTLSIRGLFNSRSIWSLCSGTQIEEGLFVVIVYKLNRTSLSGLRLPVFPLPTVSHRWQQAYPLWQDVPAN